MTTRKRPLKLGGVTKAEKAIVAQVVAESPGDITTRETQALAVTLRRSPAHTKKLIQEARDNFAQSAGRYVEIHKAATEEALVLGQDGSVGGLEVAIKSSQWALANLSAEGTRLIEKAAGEAGGARIMIGIRVGGVDTPDTAIALSSDEPSE